MSSTAVPSVVHQKNPISERTHTNIIPVNENDTNHNNKNSGHAPLHCPAIVQQPVSSSSPSSTTPTTMMMPMMVTPDSTKASSLVVATPTTKASTTPLPFPNSSSNNNNNNNSRQQPLQYIACQLHRPLHVPCWGMSLSLLDGGFLVIGQVQTTHLSPMITWWQCIHNPSLLNWNSLYHHPDLDDVTFRHFLSYHQQNHYHYYSPTSHSSLPSTSTSTPSTSALRNCTTLLPGDLLVSINGRGMSYFPTLSHVTSYIRQCHHLSLVFIRHDHAIQQAHDITSTKSRRRSNSSGSTSKQHHQYQQQQQQQQLMTPWDRACMAAQAAYRIYKNVFPNYPTQASFGWQQQQQRQYLPPPPCRRSLLPRLVSPESTTSWSISPPPPPPPQSSHSYWGPQHATTPTPPSSTDVPVQVVSVQWKPTTSTIVSSSSSSSSSTSSPASSPYTTSWNTSTALISLPTVDRMGHGAGTRPAWPPTAPPPPPPPFFYASPAATFNNILHHAHHRPTLVCAPPQPPSSFTCALSLLSAAAATATAAAVTPSHPSLTLYPNHSTFSKWLLKRKTVWRKAWKAKRNSLKQQQHRHQYDHHHHHQHHHHQQQYGIRNPHCNTETGVALAYDDDRDDALLLFDPDEGIRWRLFLQPPMDSNTFTSWLARRKTNWRTKWNVRALHDNNHGASTSCTHHHQYQRSYNNNNNNNKQEEVMEESNSDSIRTVAIDFWTTQSYPSFDHWLVASTEKWKRSYSWNRHKRKRLEMESEEIVHFPSHRHHYHHRSTTTNDPLELLLPWLRVRKHQWRIQRRKRQRTLRETSSHLISSLEECHAGNTSTKRGDDSSTSKTDAAYGSTTCKSPESPRLLTMHSSCISSSPSTCVTAIREMLFIDDLLDERERRQKELDQRPPLDITFFCDANQGVPDDVVAHCFSFLPSMEHAKVLCIDTATRTALVQREELWRQLCPKHWTLPRRPRKPWHELYLTMLRLEAEKSRKRSDDLLMNAVTHLIKGDHLQKIESMVSRGEKDFSFDINYTSGVVCERNSLLNLAVIYGRHKIVRWLMESKRADIETSDRGHFTPLLNAAWSGDKFLVRLLLSKGANRSKVGTGHYSAALAPPDFKGLTAEGWARKRGHDEIALLLAMGL